MLAESRSTQSHSLSVRVSGLHVLGNGYVTGPLLVSGQCVVDTRALQSDFADIAGVMIGQLLWVLQGLLEETCGFLMASREEFFHMKVS